MMKRDDVLNVRIPSDVKEALRRAADADERSVSVLTVRILREWLQGQGLLHAPQAGSGEKRSRK